MKIRHLLLFFLYLLTTFGFSQSADRPAYKYSVELANSISASSLALIPTFSFRNSTKHTFDVGIGTSIADRLFSYLKPFNGIVFSGSYKFYPIGKQHILNFYFHYSL